VTELFIVTNPGEQVVFVPSDGTTIPFIQVPESASSVQFQLSQSSSELLDAANGFAMLPGADKQYGFVASFSMPYGKNLQFDQQFSLPVSSLIVLMPEGMRLRSEQLTDGGLQTIQNQSYQKYQAESMAAGSSLSLKLSGTPGAATGSDPEKQLWVIIGISVVGLLLIGTGIYLYLYDRARAMKGIEENGTQAEEEVPGEVRDKIMDDIIALDDQYEAGEIPLETYEERRAALKERLKGAL
jgi:hypothetical protein